MMWSGTAIKIGDRTLKVKLDRDIPQSFSTLGGGGGGGGDESDRKIPGPAENVFFLWGDRS